MILAEDVSAPRCRLCVNMQETAPLGRAELAALLMCPLSCRDDGSRFRVQALVAGQDSRDYAAPASVAVCTHMHVSRWRMMVARWGCGSCLAVREPALSCCVCHMGLAGQLSIPFHFSLLCCPFHRRRVEMRISLSIKKEFGYQLLMILKWTLWFPLLRNHREFSNSVRKKVGFPPTYSFSPFLPCACFQINHTSFLMFSSVFHHLSRCQINRSLLSQ